MPKNVHRSCTFHFYFLKRRFQVRFLDGSEEMDGLIDFLFVRRLILGIRPSKNIKKSDFKILVYTTVRGMWHVGWE